MRKGMPSHLEGRRVFLHLPVNLQKNSLFIYEQPFTFFQIGIFNGIVPKNWEQIRE